MKKIIILIVSVFLLFLPLVLSATEDKTPHIATNATHLYHADKDIYQDNSSRLLNGSIVGTPIHNKAVKWIGEGSLESDTSASAELVHFNFNNYSNIYNVTVCGWFNFTNKDNSMLIDDGDSGFNTGFYLRWRTTTNLNLITAGTGGVGEISIFSTSVVAGNHWNHLCFIINQTGSTNTKYAYLYINGTLEASGSAASGLTDFSQTQDFGNVSFLGRASNGALNTDGFADEIVIANGSFNSDYVKHLYDLGKNGTRINSYGPSGSDTTPPGITSYNMTSEGGAGCTVWNVSKNTACETSDTTPTVFITTNESANCRIGISDLNYTNLTATRECGGGGTTSHTCTLIPADEITKYTDFVYIGCRDGSGNENQTSTSGALRVSLLNRETNARNAIESGIQNALTSGYTLYTDQKIYARNSANTQSVGVFDKVVKWMNKIWAFNFITGNDTYVNMFNITPVLYTLEIANVTNSTVNTTVYNFIQSTK